MSDEPEVKPREHTVLVMSTTYLTSQDKDMQTR